MSRMVLEAEQLAAEAAIAQQRSADFTRFGGTGLSHRFESEAWAYLQQGKHRIAVILAAGLLTRFLIAPAHAQAYPVQYVTTNWRTEQGLPQNSVNALVQDHAHATRIEAEVAYDRQFFRLRSRDNGKGIDPKVLEQGARPGYWGLPGVRERANRIGARLKLWSEGGGGTEVEMTVPARIAYGDCISARDCGCFPEAR